MHSISKGVVSGPLGDVPEECIRLGQGNNPIGVDCDVSVELLASQFQRKPNTP